MTRDIVDSYVAEALYDETIAWNIDMRGGGSVSEWPSWEELPDMAREHWLSMAVTARVASRAALESTNPADLLAELRRGVETGTIKGERVCLEHRAWFHPEDPSTVCSLYSWIRQYQGQPTACRIAVAAVIPVSDGGSET